MIILYNTTISYEIVNNNHVINTKLYIFTLENKKKAKKNYIVFKPWWPQYRVHRVH